MTPPQRRQSFDPSVADLLGNLERRQADKALPVKERQRKAKERAKLKARNRVQLDMPPELEAHLTEMAAGLSVPVSQLCVALIVFGLRPEVEEAGYRVTDFTTPSKSPRWERNIDLSELLILLRKGSPL